MAIRECIPHLTAIGISYVDALELRKCSIQLHTWFELECGNDYGCIERDETTGKAYWRSSNGTLHKHVLADREKGAQKRIAKVMARYPHLQAYVQGDPRGASLYILRPGDVPEGQDVDAYYNRGIAVYR
jgi:hypothetical protein